MAVDTRDTLLAAAKQVLRSKGHAGLSTREVAAAAGVPLSQIHYHFGSRSGLVLALFEHVTEQLLERQRSMFEDPALSLSACWDRACDYLDEDLASGYVRVLHELTVAGLSDPEVAAVVRAALRGWMGLIASTLARFEARGGRLGPFSADELAALVGGTFHGAESLLLLGLERHKTPIRAPLRRIGDLIRLLEEAPREGASDASPVSRGRR
jgi:AcrR family transcriptional regulator